MAKVSTLPTQLEVAAARAAVIAKAADRAERAQLRREEWRRRLDPASYTCTREEREGEKVWIAEGPAGQRFVFVKASDDQIACDSHTGKRYLLNYDPECGGWICDCPTSEEMRERQGGCCKHEFAFTAVLRTARAVRRAPAPQEQPAAPERLAA
jgi:hypothetical protein